MGMDIYGFNPKSKKGEYFRNNIWWWHPLWNFCELIGKGIIPEDNFGHSNSGWGLNKHKAIALAKRLSSLLSNGEIKEYEEDYRRWHDAMPDETCTICEGTGKRIKNGSEEIVCSQCNGTGKHKPFETLYQFTEENVADFRDFLLDCGGFEIW